jgi:hypothetical protein
LLFEGGREGRGDMGRRKRKKRINMKLNKQEWKGRK